MGALTAEDLPLVRKLRVAAEATRPHDLRRCAGIEGDEWVMGVFCTLHMPALWEVWVRANTAEERADAHAAIRHRLYLIEAQLESLPAERRPSPLNRLGRTAEEQRKLNLAADIAEKYSVERQAAEINARSETEQRAERMQAYRKAELAVGPVRVAPALAADIGANGGWFHIWCTAERVDARGVKTLRECSAGIHPVLGELRLPATKLGPEWAPLLRRAADIMEKRTVET